MRKMKRKPTHPGKIIKEDYLLPLAISITEMAAILGVSRKTVSKITNERGVITPEMALRLSSALDTSPELWLIYRRHMIFGKQNMPPMPGELSNLSPRNYYTQVLKAITLQVPGFPLSRE